MTELLSYEITELFEAIEKDRVCTPFKGPDCSNTAEWLCISTCCGFEGPCCVMHHDKLLDFLELANALGLSVVCDVCSARFEKPKTAVAWEKL